MIYSYGFSGYVRGGGYVRAKDEDENVYDLIEDEMSDNIDRDDTDVEFELLTDKEALELHEMAWESLQAEAKRVGVTLVENGGGISGYYPRNGIELHAIKVNVNGSYMLASANEKAVYLFNEIVDYERKWGILGEEQ